MKEMIATNFRGLQALVIFREDSNCTTLVSVLERLGLAVTVLEPEKLHRTGALPPCDLMLFDADDDTEELWSGKFSGNVPIIALVGNEAPTRLARVVRLRCDSHILKPIRTTGVFTAVLLAVNGRERRRQAERENDILRQRLAGRRTVMKAVLHLMSVCGIDEDAAYDWLRQEAMKQRVSIEDMARVSLGAASRSDLQPRWLRQSRGA